MTTERLLSFGKQQQGVGEVIVIALPIDSAW